MFAAVNVATGRPLGSVPFPCVVTNSANRPIGTNTEKNSSPGRLHVDFTAAAAWLPIRRKEDGRSATVAVNGPSTLLGTDSGCRCSSLEERDRGGFGSQRNLRIATNELRMPQPIKIPRAPRSHPLPSRKGLNWCCSASV